MLTQNFYHNTPAEFLLLSTDVKPTDCPNGSRINEIDTGKVYLFDGENKVWYEKPASGGGGSATVDTYVNGSSVNPVQNKAIYSFVNSSVSTNTANFIGTFNSVEALSAYSGEVTNNDYAFVIGVDSDGNTVYNRYKYKESTWAFEYTLNNSSFTANQWATIQSGLTSSDKTKLDEIESGANKTTVDSSLSSTSTNPIQNKTVNAALTAKQDALTFDNTPTGDSTNPVTSGGVKTALDGKQDSISDLASIRSGAAAGATAVQQVAFETDQQRQDDLEAEDRAALVELVDGGAKNTLPNNAVSASIFTHNEDGTVTATGEVGTSNRYCVIYEGAPPESSTGKWIFSGCPSGGSTTTYRLFLQDMSSGTASTIVALTGAGDYQAVEVDLSGMTQIRCQIVAYANYTANNVIFSPMLCSKPAWDISQAFVPYRPSWQEMYDMILALQSGNASTLSVQSS